MAYLNKNPKLKTKNEYLSNSLIKVVKKASSEQYTPRGKFIPKETNLEFVKSTLKSKETDTEIVRRLRLRFKIDQHIGQRSS